MRNNETAMWEASGHIIDRFLIRSDVGDRVHMVALENLDKKSTHMNPICHAQLSLTCTTL